MTSASSADRTESGVSIGYRRITDSGSCSVLLGGGEFQGFSTCRHTLESFSPDGALILGVPAYLDGIGDGVIGDVRPRTVTLLFERQQHREGAGLLPEEHVGGRHPRARAGLPGREVGDRAVRLRRLDGVRRGAGAGAVRRAEPLRPPDGWARRSAD